MIKGKLQPVPPTAGTSEVAENSVLRAPQEDNDYFRIVDKPPATGEDACTGHAHYGDVMPVTLRLQGYTGSGAG